MKLLAVDGNWILYRAFYTCEPEHIATRFLSMVCSAASGIGAGSIVVCFDGDSIFRYGLTKTYKENRKYKEGSVHPRVYLPDIKAILANHGIQFIQRPEYEADDLLCSIAKAYAGDLFVLTTDKDQRQYLRKGVTLYNPYDKVTVTESDIPKLYKGLKVNQLVDYQTLIGDDVDNIKRLVGPATALKGLLKYGSLKKWLQQNKDLHPMLEDLKLNRKLVKLIDNIEVNVIHTKKVVSTHKAYNKFLSSIPKAKSLF